eukprot:GHVR01094265.1.p1 GENE.GHVR01094265.1~~GHVR01094265.1.p1  ORF type:complete len:148 (-),score=3.29 GHVR01094265.1:28-471(-)
MNHSILKHSLRCRSDVLSKLWLPTTVGAALLALKIFGPSDFYQNNYYPLIYMLMFMWGRNMILMQLCYVVKQRFHTFNRGTIFFVITVVLYVCLHQIIGMHINSRKYFTIAAVIQLLIFFEFVYSTLMEAASILNIKIFTIKQNIKK